MSGGGAQMGGGMGVQQGQGGMGGPLQASMQQQQLMGRQMVQQNPLGTQSL